MSFVQRALGCLASGGFLLCFEARWDDYFLIDTQLQSVTRYLWANRGELLAHWGRGSWRMLLNFILGAYAAQFHPRPLG